MRTIEYFALAWLSALLIGCYERSGNVKEGQSHWLTECMGASDCIDDQVCACGVCTIACESDTSCSEGSCVSVSDEPSCADAPMRMPDVCLAQCTKDEDCLSSGLMCSAGSCMAVSPPPPPPPTHDDEMPAHACDVPNAFEPLAAIGNETCFELIAHDGDGAGPFVVAPEESINQLYYAIPWPEGSVATRFAGALDNEEVIRQWLLFSTPEGVPGSVMRNVTGTTAFEDARVLAGSGAGGCSVTLPATMGLELPGPASEHVLMVQWHHLNSTAVAQPDASRIQVCVVPRSERANIGSITVLGTEELGAPGMEPGAESKFSGTCLNDAEEPITIALFRPAMRLLGTAMHTEVERLSGEVERVFEAAFEYEQQVHYFADPAVVLQPGDKIRAECTYLNDTSEPVGFGVSVADEICFQYAFAYPAGALDKQGNVTLMGAINSCWGD
jgi:hypothetical protein